MNKLFALIPALALVLVVSGCTAPDGGDGNGGTGDGTTGPPPASLDWCVPGQKWSGYAAGEYYEDAIIHGISNMYGYWNCHVRSADGTTDIYMTIYEGTDAIVEPV